MYFGDALHMRCEDRGLNQIMNDRALGNARVAEARDRIASVVTALVANAEQQGVPRADFELSNLIFLQFGLSAIMERSRDVSPELYRR